MHKIRAIIIEDEAPARDLLQNYLQDFDNVEVVDQCEDGFEGIKAIAKHQPDLVFLDVQMPRINGFEMLELIEKEKLPLIIFTTAYDEYAIKAFEHDAIDYVLKPIDPQRIRKAVEKAASKILAGNMVGNYSGLVQKVIKPGKYLERIVLRSGEGIQVIDQEDIVFIEARNDYVIISTLQNEFLKKQTLKFYEENLDPDLFLRVHRSFVVRLDAIQKIESYTKDSFIAILKNKRKVSVSKSGFSMLRKKLNN